MQNTNCLKKIRYKLCMNQREFAQFLGVSATAIYQYETGKRQPSFPMIRRFVALLKKNDIQIEYSDLRKI
jgi:predicted transcriptional regulator